jgi:hypothetical protein
VAEEKEFARWRRVGDPTVVGCGEGEKRKEKYREGEKRPRGGREGDE